MDLEMNVGVRVREMGRLWERMIGGKLHVYWCGSCFRSAREGWRGKQVSPLRSLRSAPVEMTELFYFPSFLLSFFLPSLHVMRGGQSVSGDPKGIRPAESTRCPFAFGSGRTGVPP